MTLRGGDRSPLYQLADVLVRGAVGQSLHEWMLAGRTRVERLSWPRMSAELARLTEGRVAATTVTLRSWMAADLRTSREAAVGESSRVGTSTDGVPGDGC